LEDDFIILRAFAAAIRALDTQSAAQGISTGKVRALLVQQAVKLSTSMVPTPTMINEVLELFAACDLVISSEQGGEYLLTDLGTRWAEADLNHAPNANELLKAGVVQSWFGKLAKEATNAEDARNQIISNGKLNDADSRLTVLLQFLSQAGLYRGTIGNSADDQPEQHSGVAQAVSSTARRTAAPSDDDDDLPIHRSTSENAPSQGFGGSGVFNGLGGRKNSGGRTVNLDLEEEVQTPAAASSPTVALPAASLAPAPLVNNSTPLPVFSQVVSSSNASVQINVTLSVDLSPELDTEQGARHGRYLAALLHEIKRNVDDTQGNTSL